MNGTWRRVLAVALVAGAVGLRGQTAGPPAGFPLERGSGSCPPDALALTPGDVDAFRWTLLDETPSLPAGVTARTKETPAAGKDEYEVSGWVLADGVGVAGVHVSIAGYATATTGITGYFAFTGVPDGTYRVFAEPTPGFIFVPPQQWITLPPSAAQRVFFQAQSTVGYTVIPGCTPIHLAGRDDLTIPDPGVDPETAGFPLVRACTGACPDALQEQFPARFEVSAGQSLEFTVGGAVDYSGDGVAYAGPDGFPDTASALGPLGGISGYTGPQGALLGVFLDDANPAAIVPPAPLDFSDAALGTGFTALAPALGQVFFIGDGLGAGSQPQTFTAPAGATRLFVGLADGVGFSGTPGTYDDNLGAFAVTTQRTNYRVCGTVTDGENGLPGVTVSLGPGLEAVTDATGAYAIEDVPIGGYTATPSLADYTFAPSSRSVIVPPDAAGVDFVGTPLPPSYEISGWVLADDGGVGGAYVSVVGHATATTGSTGRFAFTGILAGTYRLMPEPLPGVVFMPPQRRITVPPSAVESVLFAALPTAGHTVVPGSTAIGLAGRDDVTIPDLGVDPATVGFPLGRNCTAAPTAGFVKETLPPLFTVGTGEGFCFAAAAGVDYSGGTAPTVGPDGMSDRAASIGALGAISGYQGPAGALVGVFLDDASPQGGLPPPALDFSPGGLGTDFTALAPALGQVFFIGDGLATGGAAQTITAPAGATRLFLGIADAFDFDGAPGAYDDNIGAFLVDVTRAAPPTAYAVSFTPGAGGTLAGDLNQSVAVGTDATPVQANPAPGQHFVHWLDALGTVYSTANPLTVTTVAARLDLTALFAANTPHDPQGQFDLRFASAVNPDARKLWDLSGGPYVLTVGPYRVSFTITQDARGVVAGAGELTGDLHGTPVVVPLVVQGRIRGSGGTVVARLGFTGAAADVVARGSATLTVDAPNLTGPVTVSLNSGTLGNDRATAIGLAALPAGVDGLYDLVVTLDLADGRVTGTGLLTLSSGRTIPLRVRARAGTAGSGMRLTGDPRLDPAVGALMLLGTVSTYADGTGALLNVQGQGFGQHLDWP